MNIEQRTHSFVRHSIESQSTYEANKFSRNYLSLIGLAKLLKTWYIMSLRGTKSGWPAKGDGLPPIWRNLRQSTPSWLRLYMNIPMEKMYSLMQNDHAVGANTFSFAASSLTHVPA